MGLEILKKGQGKYARWSAYGLIAALLLFGAVRLHATFNEPGAGVLVKDVPILGEITILKLIAAAVFLVGLLITHLVLNLQTSVNLLIDTEQEMRKVSWPSGREVRAATVIVVIVTFIMGLSLYGFDAVLRQLFHLVY